MKTNDNSHLRLVSNKTTTIQGPVQKSKIIAPLEEVESFEKAALSLIAARTTGRIRPSTIDALVLALQKATCPNTLVQRSLDFSILLVNTEGDASVCAKYDIANFGRKSLPGRTHRFWFTTPQEDINISVSTDSGIPLEIETVESSPNSREIRVHFSRLLEPANQMAYRIQYKLKRDFLNAKYYDITARTLTQKISMTILSPETSPFEMTHVGLESGDGYISDCPPLISVSNEYGRDKLTWQHRSSKPGDQFRTCWELTN